MKEPTETCRVSSRNTFEKLVHLVGFVIRIKRQSHLLLLLQATLSACNIIGHVKAKIKCSWQAILLPISK